MLIRQCVILAFGNMGPFQIIFSFCRWNRLEYPLYGDLRSKDAQILDFGFQFTVYTSGLFPEDCYTSKFSVLFLIDANGNKITFLAGFNTGRMLGIQRRSWIFGYQIEYDDQSYGGIL